MLGQNTAVPGLGTLAEFDLDHPYLRAAGLRGETLGIEPTVLVATAKIATAQFPDQVASKFPVIGADAAFAGVMGKTAQFCSLVQSADGIGAQGAETHGGDVKDRSAVRLTALRAADHDAELLGVEHFAGQHRVNDEFK